MLGRVDLRSRTEDDRRKQKGHKKLKIEPHVVGPRKGQRADPALGGEGGDDESNHQPDRRLWDPRHVPLLQQIARDEGRCCADDAHRDSPGGRNLLLLPLAVGAPAAPVRRRAIGGVCRHLVALSVQLPPHRRRTYSFSCQF